MILRVEEISKSEMHLVPITDLRQQFKQDRQESNEHPEQERTASSAVTADCRNRLPAL